MKTAPTGVKPHDPSGKLITPPADVSKYPEQIRAGLRPWQPKKLYSPLLLHQTGAVVEDLGVAC